MKIRHLGHAGLLVETGGARLLIDPGNLADQDAIRELRGLDAIAITHQHPDHVDPLLLAEVLQANPGTPVIAEPQTATLLDEGEAFNAARESQGGLHVSALAPGEAHTVGGVRIAGVGGQHAVIHPDLPRVGNTGLVITADGEPRVGVTGDSLEPIEDYRGIDVLAFAVVAPWSKAGETVEFLRAVEPKLALPVHDGVASAAGRRIYLQHSGNLSPESTEVRDWPEGDRTIEVRGGD